MALIVGAGQGESTMAGNKAQREAKPHSMGQLRESLQGALPDIKAKAKEMNSVVRRKPYSKETFIRVCERMAGGETTREALDNEGLAPSTFYQWLERDDEEGASLRTLFAHARVMLAESAFGEALQRARALLDEPEIDSARVGAARLLVDTLKWYAERLNPRQYAMQRVEPIAQTVHNVTNNNLTMIDGASLGADQRSALRAMLTQARDSKLIEG
jgi:hypothetical protein